MLYSGCDKENVTTKKLNKHIPCGYSMLLIIIVKRPNKELREIAQGILNTKT